MLMECRIAGLAYHNEDHIVDELSVGTKLALVREKNNEHDKNAVAIASACDYEGNPDEFDFRFILGYVPKDQNESIAAMLDMGYADSLEAEIIKINSGSSLFDKVIVGIFIKISDEPTYPLSSCASEQLLSIFRSYMEPKSPELDVSDIPMPTGNEVKAKKWYVRCVESDGSDYLYKTCNSKEEAQAIVESQDANTDLYEHLYIVDKEIEDIKGDKD